MTCKLLPNDIKGYKKNTNGTKYGKMTCKVTCAPTNASAEKSDDCEALQLFPSEDTILRTKIVSLVNNLIIIHIMIFNKIGYFYTI